MSKMRFEGEEAAQQAAASALLYCEGRRRVVQAALFEGEMGLFWWRAAGWFVRNFAAGGVCCAFCVLFVV